jgi:hypothetical protein
MAKDKGKADGRGESVEASAEDIRLALSLTRGHWRNQSAEGLASIWGGMTARSKRAALHRLSKLSPEEKKRFKDELDGKPPAEVATAPGADKAVSDDGSGKPGNG